MKNIFQSAIDNWPEDEAYALVTRFQEGDWTREEIEEYGRKDVAHMIEVFSRESDSEDLIKRFLDKVGESYPEIIKDFQ